MANALNSEYEWGIDKQNQGNLSPTELLGLGSLAPQSGIGLLGARPAPAALNPYASLPTPSFAPGAASDFGFEVPALEAVAREDSSGAVPANATSFKTAFANVDDPAFGAAASARDQKPYFDPNYPYESMLALKNWLSPQVAAGVAPAENARGLEYSGVGAYGAADANNYLSQLAPVGENGQQALANDYDRLYGSNITNSLIEGTANRPGDVIGSLPSSIPGATPFGNGSTNSQAALISNPNYQPPGPPAGIAPGTAAYDQWLEGQYPGLNIPGFNPTTGAFNPLPSGTYGVEGVSGTAPSTSAPVGSGAVPQYGLYDLATDTQYATPGYTYNPNQAPDTSKMPWLENATPYSAPGGYRTNV